MLRPWPASCGNPSVRRRKPAARESRRPNDRGAAFGCAGAGKTRYALLSELFDLTKQLAEAVDRNDEVTIQMLLSMREGPLAQMRQVEENLTRQRSSLSEEDGRRLAELLSGAPAQRQEENGLSGQVGTNRRLLGQLVELDKRVNKKVTREKSVYQ